MADRIFTGLKQEDGTGIFDDSRTPVRSSSERIELLAPNPCNRRTSIMPSPGFRRRSVAIYEIFGRRARSFDVGEVVLARYRLGRSRTGRRSFSMRCVLCQGNSADNI